MKNTGVVRKTDKLGRVVIPIEIRRTLGGDDIFFEIFVDGNDIVLRQYNDNCCICGSTYTFRRFDRKLICHDCVSIIKNM